MNTEAVCFRLLGEKGIKAGQGISPVGSVESSVVLVGLLSVFSDEAMVLLLHRGDPFLETGESQFDQSSSRLGISNCFSEFGVIGGALSDMAVFARAVDSRVLELDFARLELWPRVGARLCLLALLATDFALASVFVRGGLFNASSPTVACLRSSINVHNPALKSSAICLTPCAALS